MRVVVGWYIGILACAVAGCGRLGFELIPTGPDAAVDGSRPDSPVDGAAPATGCAEWGAFGDLRRLPELSTGLSEWMGFVTEDERTILLGPWISDNAEIYFSTRSAADVPFPAPQPLTGLNTTSNDRPSFISADLRELAFSSNRPGGAGGDDIWIATGVGELTSWNDPTPLSLNSPQRDGDARLSSDGLRLYFNSRRDGPWDLYVASRPDSSADFGDPVPLTGLNTPSDEQTFALAPDELEILFASDRDSSDDFFDLYRATRSSITDPFGSVEPIAELNSAFDDFGPALVRGGTVVYFNYRTDQSGGGAAPGPDVWRAERRCLVPAVGNDS